MAAASTAEGQTSTMEDQTSTSEGQTSTPEGQTLSGGNTKAMAARIGLNDNKAGMKGLDKDKINKIILEASKGSKFYENELKKDKEILKKVTALKEELAAVSEAHLEACMNKANALLSSLYQQYDFTRTIVHMDMDAFYAAVEMRDNPSLANIPMAVGGEDMLSTSNYIARRYGVRAAMPGFIARKLCADLVIVPTDMAKYSAVSSVIRSVLSQYDPNMTPLSLDEAYMDFTDHLVKRRELDDQSRTFPEFSETMCRCEPEERLGVVPSTEGISSAVGDGVADVPNLNEDNLQNSVATDDTRILPSATNSDTEPSEAGVMKDTTVSTDTSQCPRCNMPHNPKRILFDVGVEDAVREMRHRIHLKTRLTASAGIAANCLLAKICSDQNKPNGQYMLPFTVDAVQDFMKDLPVRKVPGVGKVSERQLAAFDVKVCSDFYKHRDVLYFLYSGGMFEYFLSVYLGLGANRLSKNEEGPKSKSVERTFRGMSDPDQLRTLCHELSLELAEDLKSAKNLQGKTVTLKIKLVTFEVKTRSQSLPTATNDGEDIYNVANQLLTTEMKNCSSKPLKLRLMGVRMSNFATSDSKQQKLKVIRDTNSTPSDKRISFLDKIEAERKSEKATQSCNEPLGLLAYMSTDKPIGTTSNISNAGRNVSTKLSSVWDESGDVTTRKTGKIIELLEGASNTDPWSTLADSTSSSVATIPSDSTVKTATKYGPLDFYRSSESGALDPWAKDDSSSLGVSESTHSKNRPVESYFANTRSVWDEFDESSDGDVICLSHSPVHKSTARKPSQKNKKSVKRKSRTLGQPLVEMFNAAAKKRTRKLPTLTSSSSANFEIITIDSD